jgi:diguanylate cyclase (GGDEF)-like protein
MAEHDTQMTDDDLEVAKALTRRGVRGVVPALVSIVAMASAGGGAIVGAVLPAAGVAGTALACGVAGAAVGLPLILAVAAFTTRRGLQMSIETTVRERLMANDARRRDFETRLGRALEMSDDEDAAFDVVGRAMRSVSPDAPVEMLVADNSHAHLERVVATSPDGESIPGCAVDSPDGCVAARRAQTQVFSDSEDLDACPMLRGRTQGRCSGVCVPVSIMGRTVGVVHATGPVGEPLDQAAVAELQTLSNQAGNRLGMLRVMAETQLQASTDGLTGLINRRSLENLTRQLRADGTDFALVMADLDHFKRLNDSHGHETGDRALRIFSETLRAELRTNDLACRYGGEEFAIVLPGVDAYEAVEVIGRVRESLAHTTGRGDAPVFTASFGIAHSADAQELEDLMSRADLALFAAKEAGRDRICIDGHTMPVADTLASLA